jgi:hypothetical protein
MHRLLCLSALLLSVCALSACTVGPNYTPPNPPDVANWNDRSAHAATRISDQTNPDPLWWNGFDDPVLTELMQKAIAGNLDLQQAVVRIVEARQGEVTARAASLPMLQGTGSYMREQIRLRGLLLSQGVFGQLNALGMPGMSAHRHILRMRAPTSMRTCLAAPCPGVTLAMFGHVTLSNSGNRLPGMKRVRDA